MGRKDLIKGMPFSVALARVGTYERPKVVEAAAKVLQAAGFVPSPGTHVLIKPNMVSRKNAGLSNTHPEFSAAACEVLLEMGCKVTVGDSPAFGTAQSVGRESGLAHSLSGLPVRFISLGRPTPLKLSFGPNIGISRDALEADVILNLPKLKCHGQMRMTAAVKNLFGCVVGCRKAVAHSAHGDKGNRFPTLILEVAGAFPNVVSLIDGITAMHVSGPLTGEPFGLGLVGASANPHALDAALYGMLGLAPESVPLWREALARDIPGARPEEAIFPLLSPKDFDTRGFRIPETLKPETFNPYRLLRGRIKSLCHRLF